MKHKPIEIGDKFGRLTVIDFNHKDKKNHTFWVCKCNCGNTTIKRGDNLQRGRTKSCGCIMKEIKTNSKKPQPKSKYKNKLPKSKYKNKFEIVEGKIKVYNLKGKSFYISIESKWVLENRFWSFSRKGYIITRDKQTKKITYLHNLLMKDVLVSDKEVDHIDGNPSNNCLENLRVVTTVQNQWNRKRSKDYAIFKINNNRKNPYRVNICYRRNRISLGYYPTLEEARKVRDEWEDNHERKEYFRQEVLNDNN